ncbi:sugar ABC transporter substrate-binding protein [Lactococcus hodotermopsidis]|uniref:Sugar ABC transporter substrate-binding protein n=1 Tax=Pseudolactococcus hodotermopsidis TaxID=2709157 RepID=A0A6A0BC45_9LACT|nr:extracellular solute-binding protein [Lactococcus hodotermopsidis]GFH42061.1 sugar ABC transporter substrate-binding protein [Lactococcus hodotermopsidis]
MKSWKKSLLVGAVALTAVTALTACGSKKDKGADGAEDGSTKISADFSKAAMDTFEVGDQFKATEEFSVDILYRDHPNYPWEDDWLFNTELKKLTNVSVKPVVTPMSDLEQKRSLMISSGDAPTIMTNTNAGQEAQFVASGQILAVSDYLEYMPNFSAHMDDWGLADSIDSIRQKDGKFYMLPMMFETPNPDYSLAIRKDIFDKEGIEVPETWDDLKAALKTLKAKYPDNLLYSDRWSMNATLNWTGTEFDTAAGWGYNGNKFDEKADKYVYQGATDEYKELVTFFAGMVSEGLIDKESFTQDDPTAVEKFVNGKSFVIGTNAQEMVGMTDTMDQSIGKGKYEVVRIMLPAGPAGRVIDAKRINENGMMISAKIKENPNFKAILQFIDWLWFSENGQLFARWGVEGTTYTTEGDPKNGGKIVLAKDVNTRGLNPEGTKDLQKDFGFGNGVFAHGNATWLVNSIYNDTDKAWVEAMVAGSEYAAVNPPAPLDDLDAEELAIISTNLKDTVDQETLKFILGQRPLSDWDKYVKDLESKEMKKWEEKTNAAYKEYKEKYGK